MQGCGIYRVWFFAKNHFDHRRNEAAIFCEACLIVRSSGSLDGFLSCRREEFDAAYENAVNDGRLRLYGERQNFFDKRIRHDINQEIGRASCRERV